MLVNEKTIPLGRVVSERGIDSRFAGVDESLTGKSCN